MLPNLTNGQPTRWSDPFFTLRKNSECLAETSYCCLRPDQSLQANGEPFTLCHNSLLIHATIPQQHYLIYWSENPAVLQGRS